MPHTEQDQQSELPTPQHLVCLDPPRQDDELTITRWFRKIDHPGKRSALRVLARSGNVSAAMRAADMTRNMHLYWLDHDDDYRQAVQDARAEYVDRMEAEADRRAVEGVVKPLTYQGKVFGAVREYSDLLMIFRLKRLDPAYRDNVHLSSDGSLADSGRQVVVLRPWSTKELPAPAPAIEPGQADEDDTT